MPIIIGINVMIPSFTISNEPKRIKDETLTEQQD